ncbi:hypothetical protein MAPG_00321 [Magnaporthiopsis poae ATCC 64411]|uniref:Uncharacterized protein n=1 Tax=Magnaporthiopsis poae (strain ATCC 64411 / 73-15) TaxID=644358 RepID=A0A0C4DKP3_MAGP6|nr:hypothetical protein MAPG_00321 [Magnaporthiopsis poae ATCC 64411]
MVAQPVQVTPDQGWWTRPRTKKRPKSGEDMTGADPGVLVGMILHVPVPVPVQLGESVPCAQLPSHHLTSGRFQMGALWAMGSGVTVFPSAGKFKLPPDMNDVFLAVGASGAGGNSEVPCVRPSGEGMDRFLGRLAWWGGSTCVNIGLIKARSLPPSTRDAAIVDGSLHFDDGGHDPKSLPPCGALHNFRPPERLHRKEICAGRPSPGIGLSLDAASKK